MLSLAGSVPAPCERRTYRRKHNPNILMQWGWELSQQWSSGEFRQIKVCNQKGQKGSTGRLGCGRYKLDCCRNVLSTSNAGKNLKYYRANVSCSSMAKGQCSVTWFLVVTGFLEALTQQHQQLKVFQHKVWGVCQAQAFSAFNIGKERLFIDLTLCENGNWGENGSLTIVTAWHMHVCSLVGTGFRKKLDCCTNVLLIISINWQRWQDCLFFQHERFVQSSAHSCSELEESRWFLVTTGFLEAPGGFGTKALPNTRSDVSAKLQLSQISTLWIWRRHPSLIWPFARMETVERMVLLQKSLADTRKCVLSSVLVVDMSSIAARMSYQIATVARHWTRA